MLCERKESFEHLTVDTLLVGRSLILLSPVPLNDQSISESQCRAGVCTAGSVSVEVDGLVKQRLKDARLIHIVQRSCQGSLDMSHDSIFKLIAGVEFSRGLWGWSVFSSKA